MSRKTPLNIESIQPTTKRRPPPETRQAITHNFNVAGHEGSITVGLFEDGSPSELFINMRKEGSTICGLLDIIAILTSTCLQYGIPLRVLVKKFAHQQFEPSGITSDPEIRIASSIIDYIFRWIGHRFVTGYYERDKKDEFIRQQLSLLS